MHVLWSNLCVFTRRCAVRVQWHYLCIWTNLFWEDSHHGGTVFRAINFQHWVLRFLTDSLWLDICGYFTIYFGLTNI